MARVQTCLLCAVQKEGGIVFAKGLGNAMEEFAVKLDPLQTIHIGSQHKAFHNSSNLSDGRAGPPENQRPCECSPPLLPSPLLHSCPSTARLHVQYLKIALSLQEGGQINMDAGELLHPSRQFWPQRNMVSSYLRPRGGGMPRFLFFPGCMLTFSQSEAIILVLDL